MHCRRPGDHRLGGVAKDLTILCTPSVTNFDLYANGEFAGIVVAPEATLTLRRGALIQNDFIGAVMARQVVVEDGYRIHFDESLVTTNEVRLTETIAGECHIEVPGAPGFRSVVECSSNLVDWVPMATNSGPFEFIDSDAGVIPCRFYRSLRY